MSQQQKCNNRVCRISGIRQVVVTILLTLIALSFQVSHAKTVRPDSYRVSVAGDKFSNTWQVAAEFHLRAPRRLRARHLELVVGTTSTSIETRPFVSLGPLWRLPITDRRVFLDFGFSPTVFFGSTFNNRDIGGNFHFTSSAAIGVALGDDDASSISIRIQHTSNGGLSSSNPGMDMVGLNLAVNFY